MVGSNAAFERRYFNAILRGCNAIHAEESNPDILLSKKGPCYERDPHITRHPKATGQATEKSLATSNAESLRFGLTCDEGDRPVKSPCRARLNRLHQNMFVGKERRPR